MQGFATGGEYGTSATYMSEAATANRRGFLSSFQYVTLVGGHVLAQFTLLIALSVLDVEALSDWGWRIGFFIGGIAALVVLWIRRTMDESLSESHLQDIREGKDQDAGSMKTLFTTHWRPLLLVFLITAGGTVAFYTYSVNAPAIVKSTFGADRALTATWINLLGLIFLMLLQPVGGIISDRVGRKPLLIFFGVGGVLYTYVLLTFLPQTTSPLMAFALTAVGYVILTGYTSVNAIVKAELFPAEIRALGVGLGYALANSAFGGTAPLLFQAAKSADQRQLVHRLRHGGDRREPAGLHLRAEEQGRSRRSIASRAAPGSRGLSLRLPAEQTAQQSRFTVFRRSPTGSCVRLRSTPPSTPRAPTPRWTHRRTREPESRIGLRMRLTSPRAPVLRPGRTGACGWR